MKYLRGALAGLFTMGVILSWSLSLVNGEELSLEAEESMAFGDGNALGCDNCGAECKLKCGTRLFRPCCLHFVRKRHPYISYHPLRKQQTPNHQKQQVSSPTRQNAGPFEHHFQELLAHYMNSLGTTGAPMESDFYPESE